MYEVRARNWWKENPSWPNGLEPSATPWEKAYWLGEFDTEEEARAFCREYNKEHKPGRLSWKAEYSKVEPRTRRDSFRKW